MIELSEDLRQALDRTPKEEPVRLTDSRTRQEYVLVRADVYDRLRALVEKEDDFNPREFYPLVDRIMANDDANDPTLESYQ